MCNNIKNTLRFDIDFVVVRTVVSFEIGAECAIFIQLHSARSSAYSVHCTMTMTLNLLFGFIRISLCIRWVCTRGRRGKTEREVFLAASDHTCAAALEMIRQKALNREFCRFFVSQNNHMQIVWLFQFFNIQNSFFDVKICVENRFFRTRKPNEKTWWNMLEKTSWWRHVSARSDLPHASAFLLVRCVYFLGRNLHFSSCAFPIGKYISEKKMYSSRMRFFFFVTFNVLLLHRISQHNAEQVKRRRMLNSPILIVKSLTAMWWCEAIIGIQFGAKIIIK